jgi:redox-sensitive bicupin YhaK (pirin superfamily)
MDGAGVRLMRTIATPELDHLDPFLLLDEFKSDEASDYLAGFPDHPHRGFETVTYMLAGRMQHKDHMGNQGDLGPGSVQWMTAGRGIVHSEMPQQEDGLLWGFQLWVNLPAKDKLCPARYQDVDPERIPEVELDGGGRARIVAGEAFGATGPVSGVATQPLYLDLTVPPGAAVSVPLPPEHTAFLYVFGGADLHDGEGSLIVGGAEVAVGTLAVLGAGDRVDLAGGPAGGRTLLVAGAPLNEPVARYGPFVMNTQAELLQAFADFEAGRLMG